jgi:uncharacterized GH25 family protein
MRHTVLIVILLLNTVGRAHDSWVQTNASIVRTGEPVYVDLMMGNHGNDHRDFKLAGKVDPAAATLHAVGPDGTTTDLKPAMIDQGVGPKEGFFATRFVSATPGLCTIAHTSDKVVAYAPLRSLKSAKAYVLVADSLDPPGQGAGGFDRPLGHALELVPLSHPAEAVVGKPVRVRLLLHGRPLARHKVSFIPRGVVLKDGFDERYERLTDADGTAAFEPFEANLHLVVAHHKDDAAGPGHAGTKYGATLTLFARAR